MAFGGGDIRCVVAPYIAWCADPGRVNESCIPPNAGEPLNVVPLYAVAGGGDDAGLYPPNWFTGGGE
jgi:hypothetical protein